MEDVEAIGDRRSGSAPSSTTTLTRPEFGRPPLVADLDGSPSSSEQLVAAAEGLDRPGRCVRSTDT